MNQRKEMLTEIDHLRGSIDTLKRDLNDALQKKYDSRNFNDFQIKLDTVFEQKVDIVEMQNAMNSC